MAITDIFYVRVQDKRDTEENWLSHDPVLLDGESIIVDLASGGIRRKTGDGVTKYSELPFDDADLQDAILNLQNGMLAIPSTNVVHGESKQLLSDIIETYILSVDYGLLSFDVTEIVDGDISGDDDADASSTSAVLGTAVLGQMILG